MRGIASWEDGVDLRCAAAYLLLPLRGIGWTHSWKRYRKRCPFVYCARNRDLAVHHVDESVCDRKAQPRTRVLIITIIRRL